MFIYTQWVSEQEITSPDKRILEILYKTKQIAYLLFQLLKTWKNKV
ncbi:conserved hypothetical protein [Listeria ivanovii FSL F6-596]|nr:conserved hypothetical protein [Listeria ivanovii FSL F6-596]